LLSRGSQQEVIKATQETIENTKPGGGYILMASSSLHSAVRAENYRAMVETCHEYGKY
jgi:uroporphyrinogen-III decarboxylase